MEPQCPCQSKFENHCASRQDRLVWRVTSLLNRTKISCFRRRNSLENAAWGCPTPSFHCHQCRFSEMPVWNGLSESWAALNHHVTKIAGGSPAKCAKSSATVYQTWQTWQWNIVPLVLDGSWFGWFSHSKWGISHVWQPKNTLLRAMSRFKKSVLACEHRGCSPRKRKRSLWLFIMAVLTEKISCGLKSWHDSWFSVIT